MISIISSISADVAADLLQPEVTKRLSLFHNVETAERVFDYLWDHSDHIDFVIVEQAELDVKDLYSASQKRPDAMFIIIGNAENKNSIGTLNVSFAMESSEIYQSIVSTFF